MLASHGIASEVRGADLGAGVGQLPGGMVEVWVHATDLDAARARWKEFVEPSDTPHGPRALGLFPRTVIAALIALGGFGVGAIYVTRRAEAIRSDGLVPKARDKKGCTAFVDPESGVTMLLACDTNLDGKPEKETLFTHEGLRYLERIDANQNRVWEQETWFDRLGNPYSKQEDADEDGWQERVTHFNPTGSVASVSEDTDGDGRMDTVFRYDEEILGFLDDLDVNHASAVEELRAIASKPDADMRYRVLFALVDWIGSSAAEEKPDGFAEWLGERKLDPHTETVANALLDVSDASASSDPLVAYDLFTAWRDTRVPGFRLPAAARAIAFKVYDGLLQRGLPPVAGLLFERTLAYDPTFLDFPKHIARAADADTNLGIFRDLESELARTTLLQAMVSVGQISEADQKAALAAPDAAEHGVEK